MRLAGVSAQAVDSLATFVEVIDTKRDSVVGDLKQQLIGKLQDVHHVA